MQLMSTGAKMIPYLRIVNLKNIPYPTTKSDIADILKTGVPPLGCFLQRSFV